MIDPITLLTLKETLTAPELSIGSIAPPPAAYEAFHPSKGDGGFLLMKEGKVACLLIAGGQGTRLGYDGPKGTYPISPIEGKSLFQMAAEKTKAASVQAGRALNIAIMTSRENDAATRRHFAGHGNFGLSKEQLSFFVQGELPFLSESGEPLVKEDGSFVMGPDGNGKCLHALATSGILQKWKERGVQYINIILVDNPLAVPFDAELLGWHAHLGGDVVVKCVPRDNPEEKVGVLVSEEGKIKVIEYSEMPKEAMRDTAKYPYANISLFSVTMDFAEKVANKELPLHKAYKPAATKEGIVNGWKFEYFIFDFLPFASAYLLVYPRSEIFAPLKAKEGSNSPEEVKKSLEVYERTLFERVTGLKAPKGPLELDAQFYYPTPALKGAWKSAPLADGGFIPSKV